MKTLVSLYTLKTEFTLKLSQNILVIMRIKYTDYPSD